MSKRKYKKSSSYWDKFKKEGNVNAPPLESLIQKVEADDRVQPASAGDSYYVSSASYGRASTGTSTSSRRNSITAQQKSNRFANVRAGLLPYDVSADGVDVRDAIELCQKAYANVSIFRNAVDIMAELANSPIYVEGGNEASRTFVQKWFSKINLWDLKDQFFREYYRSGNIFLYRVDGKFTVEDFAKLHKVYGGENYIKPNHIPIKYILLNPYDITATRSTSFKGGGYKKVLSEYEIERLQSPKTDIDKEIYKALPSEVKKQIKEGSWSARGISMPLDPKKLCHAFYKKQDYEPFAIPFGFPVLDDINWKMELKKVDQAISRTIENVILLITMGADPDKGGINPSNLQAMQSLFQNESVGRVLVADYTTKAEFILPDIGKVIGPEKYQIVNEDIRQGLQNVIVGDEKYKNTQVKAEIFLERLKEAILSFLHNFLQQQIKVVCNSMGFKVYPTARFEEIDIKDEVQLQRVVTRLLEIGILTPEQGIDAIKTGIYPNPKDIEPAQQNYVEKREKGYYNPLVGGVPLVESEESQQHRKIEEKGLKIQEKQINQAPKLQKAPAEPMQSKNQTPKSPGRPAGSQTDASELYSRKEIQGIIYKIEGLEQKAKATMMKKMGIKKLSEQQESLVSELCKSVILAKSKSAWTRTANACIRDFNKIEKLSVIPGISELSGEHQLEIYPAALLYHSK